MMIKFRSSREELLDGLERIGRVRACVIGDIVLDRYIWGKVERISPEAPVPVVCISRTEDRLGCAGNAAVNLRKLGCEVTLCGVVGEDEEGRALEKLLGREGISSENILIDQKYPTIVKTRVIAQSQQVVRIDKEILPKPSPERVKNFLSCVERALLQPDVLVVSDYGKGTVLPELFNFLEEKRSSGGFRAPVVVDPHPVNSRHYSHITIAKPNRAEAERASGVDIHDKDSALECARKLRDLWSAEMMMITLGEGGLVIVSPDHEQGLFLETVARSVFDVSGAGDTVTAVFAAGLGAGLPVVLAGELANIAAGIVVSEVGTVPITKEKLIEFIDDIRITKGTA